MSYATINLSANDQALRARIMACAAQEGAVGDPGTWTNDHIWKVVTATEIEDAYEYALGTGNTDPGGDEGVITDAVILAHVQPLILAGP